MDAGRTAIGVCFAIVAISAIWDLVSRRIPNVLTLGGIALGVALRVALGYTDAGVSGALRGLAWAFAGIGLCGILPLLSYIRGEIGGADLKLFAAIGALCGPALGFNAQAWTYGVVVLAVLPFRVIKAGAGRAALLQVKTDVMNMFRPRDQRLVVTPMKLPAVPMGPSIFVGMCVAFTFQGVFR
jgi:prepilin peptidase CpaA